MPCRTANCAQEPAEETMMEKKSYGRMLHYETEFQKNALPFWRTNVMYGESAAMILREDGRITASLLFSPVKILEIRDVTQQKVYVEGKDYLWEAGTNTLLRIDGSAIPYFTDDDLAGRKEDGTQVPAWGDAAAGWTESRPWDARGRSRFADALYCIGEFYYGKQIAVTYEYPYEAWQGAAAEYQGDNLPKTIAKLESGEQLKLMFYGDSIFTGCDASKMYGRAPRQEYFSVLTKKALEEKYAAKVTLSNPSVGGMDSCWGAQNAARLAAAEAPDLVVIGFGMNDGGKTSRQFAENIRSIVHTVRASRPDCEFILVAPMVPNEKSGFLTTQNQFSAALAELRGTGIGFADMFAVHRDILQYKDYAATSGNNINHPNDWPIRVYAMNIISCLVEF